MTPLNDRRPLRSSDGRDDVDSQDDREDRDDGDRPQEKYDPRKDKERRRRHQKEVEKAIRDYWSRYKDRAPHHTPWLLIRYASGDFGFRPIPGNIPFWLSPDVWIESSDPNGSGVAGEANHVWVRIFNLGRREARPVRVDFYWANPALGLGAANMNLIGTEWTAIKSQFLQEVRCSRPWIPVLVNGGHECLMVNCTDPILDPITAPFEPRLDRHVGQRNITVVPGTAGRVVGFKLELNNFFPMAVNTVVFAAAAHLAIPTRLRREMTRMQRHEALAAWGIRTVSPSEMQARLAPGTAMQRMAARTGRCRSRDHATETTQSQLRQLRSAPRLATSISEARSRMLGATPARMLGQILAAKETLAFDDTAPRAQLQAVETLTMTAQECRNIDLELHVPDDARPGEYVVVHLEQWAERLNLGGYAIIVEVGKPGPRGRL